MATSHSAANAFSGGLNPHLAGGRFAACPGDRVSKCSLMIGRRNYFENSGLSLIRLNHLAAFCLMWLDRHDEAEDQIATAIGKVAEEYSRVFRLSSLFNRALRAVRLELDDADDAIRAFFVALFDAQIFDYGQHVRPLLGGLCSAALRRGIESGIVRDLIKRRKLVPPADAPAEWPWPVKIESLSGFHVYLWDEPLIFDGKSQKKPMEMLMLLVALGDPLKPNKGARIDEIIDELWPSTEAKDPKGSFDVNVHRLRKLLQVDEAIVISEGRLKLNRDFVWCDAHVFESMAIQVLGGGKQPCQAEG